MDDNKSEFRSDLSLHASKVRNNLTTSGIVVAAANESKLGDVLQTMARNGLLMARKKEDNYSIDATLELSDETADYLNLLQTEKCFHCRKCYRKDADDDRCDFHKKYIFDKDQNEYRGEYTRFLNSEMGVISYIELYYTYLGEEFWNFTSRMLLRDLTGFSTIKSLLTFYGYVSDENVDRPFIEIPTPMEWNENNAPPPSQQ